MCDSDVRLGRVTGVSVPQEELGVVWQRERRHRDTGATLINDSDE